MNTPMENIVNPVVNDGRVNRMSIILFSGTVDKLLAASIMATGASAMGLEVDIFLTMWGMMAFRKGAHKELNKVSADFAEYAPMLQQKLSGPGAPNWMENLEQAKEIGDVHVYACGMTLEMFGMSKTDLEDIVDDVVGVAGFVERAKEGKVTLFV